MALMALNSCSWYRDVERSLVEGDDKKSSSKTISRAQYDNLLVKYEELSKKYELLKENRSKDQPSLKDEIQQTSSENFSNTSSNVETVDAFSNQPVAEVANVSSDVESQLSLYKKAVNLKSSASGDATKIFQQLETQGIPEVKVRSKLQIGEMLYEKGQYDLALQVFEDIINKYAYSGVVLESLKYAQICSEKLGLQNKKDQYSSMINDVFEAK
jgi:tetratricopeptide (TPR) repeat protein